VIDRHPEWARVFVASPCSGHGFKHSAAIGEAIAERVIDGASRLDLTPFSLARLISSARSDGLESAL
jgi:sarcosine oxidase